MLHKVNESKNFTQLDKQRNVMEIFIANTGKTNITKHQSNVQKI